MSSLLKAAPLVALVLAAIDTVATRRDFSHRPASAEQLLQALALWMLFVLLALVPAAVGRWLVKRSCSRCRDESGGLRHDGLVSALLLGAFAGLPVLAHSRLDAYTSLGADLSQLKAIGPWLDVGGWTLGGLAALAVAYFALRPVPAALAAAGACALALGAGLFVSFHEEGDAPVAPESPRPNLLLMVWDTTRARSLNLYGYERDTTPSLAQLAEQCVVFEEARSPSRYTLTSHLSMLTGVYPSHHGARMVRQVFRPSVTPSVVQALREAGYRTGGFMGTGVLRAQTGVGFGFEVWDDQVDPPVCDTYAWGVVHDVQSALAGFGPPFSRNGHPHVIEDFTRPASEVLSRALDWIRADDPRPWFCMINMYDVHWPYLPPEPERERWVAHDYAGPIDGFVFRSDEFPSGYELDTADNRHLEELYDAEMHQLDRDVDAFLSELGLLESNDTALVMLSDHGEAFGEGGRYEHGDILESQVRIPCLVRVPDGSRAGRETRRVSGIDVAPTLLDLAGLQAPDHYLGRSLLREPAEGEGRLILVEDRDHMKVEDVRIALYRDHWKLVRSGLGEAQEFQLFDLRRDELGVDDVAGEHPAVVTELREELERLRGVWGVDDLSDARTGGDANLDALKALGYTGD